MTNVKFRSWIPSIQTFTYFENGVYSCQKVQFDKVPFDWDNAEQCFIINKKEFYIGDIIAVGEKTSRFQEDIAKVISHNGSAMLKSVDFEDETKEPFKERYIDRGWYEKIGNIHESPELLKENT